MCVHAYDLFSATRKAYNRIVISNKLSLRQIGHIVKKWLR